jgi:hypothetical protein
MGSNKVEKFAVRKIIFCTVLTRAAKAGQNYIVWARRANKRTKEGPLSYVLQEFPVLTISRGHPSLFSLVHTKGWWDCAEKFWQEIQQIMLLQ